MGISTLFLLSYLNCHGLYGSTRFVGQGWTRIVYFSVLLSHTILAAAIIPLIFITFRRAHAGRFKSHRSLARWTWPLWLYVSVTGVAIYLMLY